MQKIEINNFGPIERASIEVAPLTVLIGQQASGKSTIAKLIYFFKSLGEYFFTSYYNSPDDRFSLQEDLFFPFRDKFYDMFGNTYDMPDFNIKYWYDTERHIDLTRNSKKRLQVTLSPGFFPKEEKESLIICKKLLLQLKDNLGQSPVEQVAAENRRMSLLNRMSEIINRIFCVTYNDALYIPAGRNATVGYNDVFESLLSATLKQNLEDHGKGMKRINSQTIDEALMLQFMQRVSRMRQMFAKSGNFDGLISIAPKERKDILSKTSSLIEQVLKGKYASSSDSEKIMLRNRKFVYLRNASSGQQESIRILQDAFWSIFSGNTVLRVIEEPEAHLYPEAQMLMLQVLAVMLNSDSGNQMVVTTHSPYVLSVFNNLIYAWQVGQKHAADAEQILDRSCWLNPAGVRAYMLADGNSSDIMDKELDVIKAEMIDMVSETLNTQYDMLMNIEFKENGDATE